MNNRNLDKNCHLKRYSSLAISRVLKIVCIRCLCIVKIIPLLSQVDFCAPRYYNLRETIWHKQSRMAIRGSFPISKLRFLSLDKNSAIFQPFPFQQRRSKKLWRRLSSWNSIRIPRFTHIHPLDFEDINGQTQTQHKEYLVKLACMKSKWRYLYFLFM